MIQVRLDPWQLREAVRRAGGTGRFQSYRPYIEKAYDQLKKEAQVEASRSLAQASRDNRAKAARKIANIDASRYGQPIVTPRTGRLGRAIRNSAIGDVRVTSTRIEFGFGDQQFLDSQAAHWRHVEFGAKAQIGKVFVHTTRARFSAARAGRGGGRIKEPIQAYHHLSSAARKVAGSSRFRRVVARELREAYPGFSWR